jgi:HAE1 family hydrophobic/amphiphilic exporter-1
VVDDAIVVVEAVHSKMQLTKLSAKKATVQSMSEISGAIVSITLVMSAVFIPVGFMQGPAGVFYRQFAFTLAIAIVISAVNALTLSPALCALFLKSEHHDDEHAHANDKWSTRFFRSFNAGFNAMTDKYLGSVNFLVKHKWLTMGGLAIVTAATVWMLRTTPTGFIPNEDQSFFVYSITLPPGSSLQRTREVVKKVENMMEELEATNHYLSVSGLNIITSSISSNYAVGFVKMKPHDDRGQVKDINAIMGMVQGKLSTISEADIFTFTMPTVPALVTWQVLNLYFRIVPVVHFKN